MSVLELFPSPARRSDGLFAQIVERLAVRILTRQYQAGDLLPSQDELGRDLPASRTAYREAVKYLTSKGLIEARPKSGTRVAPRANWNLIDPEVLRWSLNGKPSDKLVCDLFEIRRIIEPNAARLAAERRTAEQLDTLRRAIDGMMSLPVYTEANYRADIAFHDAIVDGANNAALACLKGLVRTTILWSVRLNTGLRSPKDFAKPLADHRRVFEAIEQRDGERASAFMTVLVVDAVEEALRNIAHLRASEAKADGGERRVNAHVVPLGVKRSKGGKPA